MELEQLVDERTLNLLKKKQEQAVIDKMTAADLSNVILKPAKKAQKTAPDFIKRKEVTNLIVFGYLLNKQQPHSIETIEEQNVLSTKVFKEKFIITSNGIEYTFWHGSLGWHYDYVARDSKSEKIKITKKTLEEVTKIILNDWLQHFDEAVKLP